MTPTRSCSRGRRSPSSGPVPARRTGAPSRDRSAGSSPRPGSSSSAAGAGHRRRGASRRARCAEARRSRCSAAASTVTIRQPTASSPGGSPSDGLIVSEYEPGVEPAPWRFPARNRIIAGLCAATVVVEARERSGALITADFALEDGREVMVVPGEITSRCPPARTRSSGSARPRSPLQRTSSRRTGSSPTAEPVEAPEGLPGRLLARLTEHPASIDELARTLGLEPGEVAAALIELELAGLGQRGGRRLPFGGEDVGKAAGSTIRACHVPPASCSRSPPRSCRPSRSARRRAAGAVGRCRRRAAVRALDVRVPRGGRTARPRCRLHRLPSARACIPRARACRLFPGRPRWRRRAEARDEARRDDDLRLPAGQRDTSQRRPLPDRDRRAGLPRRAHLRIDEDRRARLAGRRRSHGERDRGGEGAQDPLQRRHRCGGGARAPRHASHPRPRRANGRDARSRRLARRLLGARDPGSRCDRGAGRGARRAGCADPRSCSARSGWTTRTGSWWCWLS